MNTLLDGTDAVSSADDIPSPLDTTVIVQTGGELIRTKIVRLWAEADVRACSLCPLDECVARRTRVRVLNRHGRLERLYSCTVPVVGRVDRKSAPLFSLRAC